MSVKALNNYVVIKPNEGSSIVNGIYLVDSTTVTGTIVSVGSLCKSKVRPGDIVMIYRSSTGSNLRIDGLKGEHWIVPESNLLAVINDGETNGV